MTDVDVSVATNPVTITFEDVSVSTTIEDNSLSVSIPSNTVSTSVVDNAISITLGAEVLRLTYVNEDEELRFNGATGNTYFIYNSSNNRLELYVNGVIKKAWS